MNKNPPDLSYSPDEAEDEFALLDLIECLDAHLQKAGFVEGEEYKARVENFGWRKQNGSLKKPYKKGRILQNILPQCECTFNIWFTEKGFELQNFHHDSCNGDEMYYVEKGE